MNNDENYIATPFTGLMINWGISLGKPHYFNTGTLFWSFSRLFLHYERVIRRCLEYKKGEKNNYDSALASDLESFIIRFRVVLNDLACIIRKIYPHDVPGMPGFKSGGEISFFDLKKFFKNHKKIHPELSSLLEKQEEWLNELKTQRDDIIHYKAMVVIFSDNEFKFQIISPTKCPSQRFPEGGEKVIMIPVFDFINSQLLKLYNFVNSDLVSLYEEYLIKNKIEINSKKGDCKLLVPEGFLFKKINKL